MHPRSAQKVWSRKSSCWNVSGSARPGAVEAVMVAGTVTFRKLSAIRILNCGRILSASVEHFASHFATTLYPFWEHGIVGCAYHRPQHIDALCRRTWGE